MDFYVTSANVIGEAPPSDVLTLYVAAVPAQPSPPTEGKVFSISSGSQYASALGIQVDWTAPADNGAPLLGFRLFMAEEELPLQLLYDGSGSSRPDVASFTVWEGISKGLDYKFRVQAVNAVGASPLSDELLVPATVPPSAPRDLAVVGSGAGSLSLSWLAPAESGGTVLTGYYFYYQTEVSLALAPDAWLKSTPVSAAASAFVLGGLTPDSRYVVRIAAENARGEGAYSSSVTHYAAEVPTSLAALAVVAGSRTRDSLAVSWGPPGASTTDVLGYRLYANAPDSGAVPGRLVYDGAAVPGLREARVSGLESGRTYWFSYTALNRAGWSSPSWPYLRVVAGPLPSPPGEAPTVVSTSPSQIAFRWAASPDAAAAAPLTAYRLYDRAALLDTVAPGTLSYAYSGVTAGSSYLISVAAVSEIGESERRSLATLIWAVDVPAAPALQVVRTSRDSCGVVWGPVPPPAGTLVTGYVVMIDDGRTGPFRVAHAGQTDPSLFEATIYGLRARTTYRITGYALNKAGPGANSTVTTCYTASAPGVPGRPTLVSSTASSIEVEWEPAFDDGGSPIKEYQLWIDEVEGLGPANVEDWGAPVYAGSALTANVATGLTAGKAYRFRVQAMSEQLLQSPFSGIATYWAAPLPAPPTFDTAGGAHLQTSRSWIQLTWIRPTLTASDLPIDSYRVYWDQGTRSSGNFTLLAVIDGVDNNFLNVSGILTTGQSYRFQVSAVNGVGEGPLSDEVFARAASLPGRLRAPERAAATGLAAEAQITLRWYQQELVETGGVPLTGFRLYYFEQVTPDLVLGPGAATLAFDGADSPEITAFTLAGLTLDVDYSFFVTALNPDEGPPGDLLTVRAGGFPDVTLLTISETAGSRTGSSIGLEWPAPADDGGSPVLAYTLAIQKDNREDSVVYYGSSPRAVVGGLTAGQEYQFKVKATTAVGDSAWSRQSFAFLIVAAPSAPLSVEVVAFDNTYVSLRWARPLSSGGQPTSGFRVFREDCTLAATEPELLASVPASQFQYTDAAPTAGRDYRYYVAAFNVLGGEGELSAGAPVRPVSVPVATAAPRLVAKGQDFITVEWLPPSSDRGAAVAKYILYVRAEYDSAYQQVYAGISLSFRLSADQFPALVRPGFEYSFKVRSANAAGLSALSPASQTMLTAVEPSAPRDVSLVARSATSLTIRWSRPADSGGAELLGYWVYVAEGSGAYSLLATAPSSADPTALTHEQAAPDLTPGQPYKFRVTAFNIIGEGEAAQLRTDQPLVGDAVDYVLAADLPEAPPNPPNVASWTEAAISLTLEAVGPGADGGAPVTGYLVEIDDGLGGGAGPVPDGRFRRVQDSLATSLIIAGLRGGRTYSIRYAARNLVYDSGNMFGCDSLKWSPLARVLTAVAPSAPVGLRQVSTPDGSGRPQRYRTRLAVEWDPLVGAGLGSSQLAGYTLAILDIDGTGLETSVNLPAEARSHTFSTLQPGHAFSFRIRATTLVGESDWSDPTEPLYPGVEPTRPGAITFTTTTRTSITYEFTALAGQDTGGTDALPLAVTYHIFMSTEPGRGFSRIASSPTATALTAAFLGPGVTYYFKY